MNPRLKALHAKLEAFHAEGAALDAKGDWSEAEDARAKALPGDIEATEAAIKEAVALGEKLGASREFLNGRAGLESVVSGHNLTAATGDDRYESLKNCRTSARFFQSVSGNRDEAQKKAYRFGMFIQGGLLKKPSAMDWCAQNGIPLNAGQVEGNNEDGGVLVPMEFENDMIILREMFGMFRQNARNSPMRGDQKRRPRRKGGLSAFFVGESEAADESKKGWDAIELNAKKLMVLTRYSNELGEDAVINVGDDLAGEIAYAFAKKEDGCGFIGDGTSTYGGIKGVTKRLADVYGAGGGVGLILGSGNAWSELTLSDFQKVVGALPVYAETPAVKWYCHKVFFETVMVRLMMAAGGVTAAEILNGLRRQFMGYEVVPVQVMAKTEANSQIPVFFGDLRLAADFGDRRATTVAMSEHVHWDTDEIGVRGTERFDVNVHDVGDATDAGPIVGLETAAS